MLESRKQPANDEHLGNPIPFPTAAACGGESSPMFDSIQFAKMALELADRRMQNLASMLDCLGHFDEDSDGPRAA
jgi:hypothetical protein